MPIWILFIYGIIQGLTEFLPVSSSAHLALIPFFFDSNDPGVAFDLAMHIGTALSVVIYFHKTCLQLLKDFFYIITFQKTKAMKADLVFNFISASLVTVVFALIFKEFAASYARTPVIMSINLIVFGVLMHICDSRFKEDLELKMDSGFFLKHSFLIGLFQGLAIFPGVSRSGATLTISRYLNLSRTEATKFSFLLGLPVIFGGFLLKLKELEGQVALFDVCFGIIVSFFVGLLTIHFFLKAIGKLGLLPFSIYRVVIGIAILVISFLN